VIRAALPPSVAACALGQASAMLRRDRSRETALAALLGLLSHPCRLIACSAELALRLHGEFPGPRPVAPSEREGTAA
jgi:hypothetical protein